MCEALSRIFRMKICCHAIANIGRMASVYLEEKKAFGTLFLM